MKRCDRACAGWGACHEAIRNRRPLANPLCEPGAYGIEARPRLQGHGPKVVLEYVRESDGRVTSEEVSAVFCIGHSHASDVLRTLANQGYLERELHSDGHFTRQYEYWVEER